MLAPKSGRDVTMISAFSDGSNNSEPPGDIGKPNTRRLIDDDEPGVYYFHATPCCAQPDPGEPATA